jgi:predicted phosphodiesterase
VLQVLYAAKVDLILNAGDLVGYGAHPNSVIQLLRSSGIQSVVGNYDEAVAWDLPRASRTPSSPTNEPLKQAALDWAKVRTSSEAKYYLRGLPLQLEYKLDDWRIQVIHAGLDYTDEWFTPDEPQQMAVLAARTSGDLVVLGHTHRAFTYECNNGRGRKTLFINPGAVGRALDGDTRAAYAIFDTERGEVQLNRVEYDLEMAVQSIERSGMPAEIAQMVRLGLRRVEQLPSLNHTQKAIPA